MNRYLTARQVAEKLGMSVRYFGEKFCYRHGFPAYTRLTEGGHRKWLESDVDAWLESRRAAA